MDEFPPTKHPSAFTGVGFEIIGDPSDKPEHVALWFREGKFDGLRFPGQHPFRGARPRRRREKKQCADPAPRVSQ